MCQLPARPAAAKINSAVPSPMWAVVQALQQRGRNVGHIRVLVDLAVHADPEARRLIRQAGRHIGEVLAGAVNLLNPDALVITGDMAKAYDIFVAGLRETVYGNATAVATRELQILPSTHGDQSGVIGSAAMILGRRRQICRAPSSPVPGAGDGLATRLNPRPRDRHERVNRLKAVVITTKEQVAEPMSSDNRIAARRSQRNKAWCRHASR